MSAEARIGPGRLVLVVGPSGAGKDTLIRVARDALAGDPAYVFPRRIVTRPPSEAEDNEGVESDAFARLLAEGRLTASWEAHGLSYGLPAAIDDAIRGGRTVVCNVSRMVVAELRARYAEVIAVEVTAPPAVLAQRLVGRNRPEDGDPAARLRRSAAIPATRPDAVVENAGPVEEAARVFLRVLAGEEARLDFDSASPEA